MVDWNDDGAFEDCPAGVCAELGYSGGVYVFNTTHFTAYGSDESSVVGLAKSDSPDPD